MSKSSGVTTVRSIEDVRYITVPTQEVERNIRVCRMSGQFQSNILPLIRRNKEVDEFLATLAQKGESATDGTLITGKIYLPEDVTWIVTAEWIYEFGWFLVAKL
ncbi:MAG: hypothetical protein ACYC6X_03470 [Minisyncoccota bacterium]